MAGDMELNVKLALESQSFTQQITVINREMKLAQAEFANASTALGNFGNEEQKLELKSQTLSSQIQMSQQKVDLLTTAHEKAKQTLATNVAVNEELRQSLERATAAYNQSAAATGENSAESIQLKAAMDALNTQYTQSNTLILRNATSADNLNIRLQNTQAAQNRLQNELTATNTDLEAQRNGMDDVGDSADENGEKAGGFRAKIAEIGNTVMLAGITALGAAFTAVAGAGVIMSDDLQGALNELQTQTGMADEAMGGMKESVLDIYNSNAGEGFQDIAKSMADVGKTTGATGDELEGLTKTALLVRDSFGMEVGDSIKTANTLMKNFGLSGTEAYNLISQGAQQGMDKNGDLLDVIGEYSLQFKSMGFSADEMFNMINNGSKAGGISIDSMGDAVKEFNIRSKDGSKATMEAFQALGLDANKLSQDFAAGGEKGKAAFGLVNTALANVKDPLVQNQLGVALWGTMFEDNGKKAIFALNNTTGEINKSKDALGKMAELNGATFGATIEGIKRQLITGIVLPIGEQVLPKLQEFGAYLSANMPQIIEGIKPVINGLISVFELLANNMSLIIPAIAGVVAGFAAFNILTGVSALMESYRAATAGVTIAQWALNAAMTANPIGLVVVAIAGVVAGVVLAYKHFDELKAQFLSMSPAVQTLVTAFTFMNPVTGIIAGVTLAIKGVQYAMSDSIPAANLFGEGVSAGTKKAVQGYLDLDDQATKSLMSLKFSGQTVTNETANAIEKNFYDMGVQVKAGMDKHYGESLTTMKDYFTKSSALTETEEAAVLAKMETSNTAKKEIVDSCEKQIKLILDKATAEKRSLTASEQVEINGYQETMKTNAVKALSDTELESKSILERMKAQAGEITAKQAAEVVKNSLEQKDKAVKNAEEQYDKTVKEIIKQRDETGAITKDQADKLILEAEKQRDGAVTKATEMNEKVVEQAKLQAGDHVKQVDWTTGEIKSKWQIMKDDTAQKMSDIGKDIATKWEDVKKDTATKMEDIKKDLGTKWEAIKSDVSSKVDTLKNDLSTKWENIKSDIATKVDGIKSDAETKWEAVKTSVGTKIDEMKTAVGTKMEEVKTAISSKWEEAKTYLSQIDLVQIGKDIIQGLIDGIKSKVADALSVVSGLAGDISDAISDALDINSPSRVMIRIGSSVGEGLVLGISSQSGAVKAATQSMAGIVTSSASAISTSAGMITTDLRTMVDNRIASINAELAAINQQTIDEKKAADEQAFNDEQAELQKTLNKTRNSAARAKIQKQIDDNIAAARLAANKAELEALEALEAANEEYDAKTRARNAQLLAETQKLVDAYDSELTAKTQELYSSTGLFDGFRAVKSSSDVLLENLQSQVDGVDAWQANISTLASKGINDGLLKEITDMGPKATGEIAALASMSEPELTKYQELWTRKHQQAAEGATKELAWLKTETDKQIKDLNDQAAIDLDGYKTTWVEKIGSIIKSSASLGGDIVSGLVSGIESKAQEAANAMAVVVTGIQDILSNISLSVNMPAPETSSTTDGMEEMFNSLTTTIGGAIDNIKQIVSEAWRSISDTTSNVWKELKDDTVREWNDITNSLQEIGDAIEATIITVWDAIKLYISDALDGIKSDAETKWEAINVAVTVKVEELKTAVVDKFNALALVVSDVWAGMENTIKESINTAINMINGFINHINAIVIHVPRIEIPFVGVFGGFDIDMPDIPTIPLLTEGGIFNPPRSSVIAESGAGAALSTSRLNDLMASAMQKAGGTGTTNQYTFAPGSITIPAKDLAEMRTVQDFFNRLPQVARAGGY